MNNTRFASLLIFALFLSILIVASPVAATPTVPITTNGLEIEPNDDFDTATYINWDAYTRPVVSRAGAIDPAGDVDFHYFYAYPLDTLAIEWQKWGSSFDGTLTLYNADGGVLAESTCTNGICLQYAFTSITGRERFYLKVATANGAGGPDYSYRIEFNYLGKRDLNEPNNSIGQATPVAYDETRVGALAPCGENDYFTFPGHAGDVIEIDTYGQWQVLDATQTVIAAPDENWTSKFVLLPVTGAYYLRFYGDACDVEYVFTIRFREREPNNSIATAIPVAYGEERSTPLIWPCNDEDFYSFTGKARDDVEVITNGSASVQLLDKDQNIIDEDWDGVMATLPYDGVYYLRFWNDYCEVWGAQQYWFRLSLLGNTEPNDSFAQANLIDFGEPFRGLVTCEDSDYLAFTGTAGEEVRVDYSGVSLLMQLFDVDHNLIAESNYNFNDIQTFLPRSGSYFLKLSMDQSCEWAPYSYEVTLRTLTRPLYLSLNKGGAIRGVQFTAGDVLRYWPDSGRLEMFVDMSDLGLKGNLTALDRLEVGYGYHCWYGDLSYGGGFILGFGANYALPGFGTVPPHDLIGFTPYSTGADTSGRLDFIFDGSDAGLTTTGERIDAVAAVCHDWPRWFLSTTGRAKVPGAVFENEDLPWFNLDSQGFNTSGSWWPYFDGSLYGLAPVNITGADLDADYTLGADMIWLSFNQSVTFDGVKYEPGDIAACFDLWGEDDRCEWTAKYFDASDAGFGGFMIDAFEVGDTAANDPGLVE
mgnify:CR=1 FL=1